MASILKYNLFSMIYKQPRNFSRKCSLTAFTFMSQSYVCVFKGLSNHILGPTIDNACAERSSLCLVCSG